MKFCYGTNLRSFIMPSLQNCYRVGKSNTYIISILNPYIMYKDYYTLEDIMDFYVSFKTINNGQNITITPNFDKYSINKRILEGYPNSIKIPNNEEKKFLIMKNIYLFEWKFAHLMHLLNMNFIIQFIILN